MKPPRWLLAVALVVGLLALADAAAWFAAEQALARGFARWAAGMAAQGIEVAAGPASPGGFPLRVTRGFALTLRSGAASLRSHSVVLVLSPWAPDRLRVDLPAPVSLRAPFLPPLAASAPDWHLEAPLSGIGPVATDAKQLTLTVATAGAPRTVEAALLHLQLQPAPDGLDMAGSAQSITLPEPLPGEVWPLGRHMASLAFEAVLSGHLAQPTAGPAALAAWRDSGGAVALRRIALGYGPLGVSGQARLGLDAALRPAGTAALHVLGYADTLDALAAAHVITAHAARAAEAVLALLAAPPPGGGVPQVALDVTMRDGVLTVAGFPLLRLPPLAGAGAA